VEQGFAGKSTHLLEDTEQQARGVLVTTSHLEQSGPDPIVAPANDLRRSIVINECQLGDRFVPLVRRGHPGGALDASRVVVSCGPVST
jgi:hypothetical protein